ncbi:MAG: NAD(P)-dependent oxidoreductase [Limnohabitans sp.]|uniref:NAD(P)-dependent oxidoreductase n=1 Tax=Limnohabitans sp. TaxID=1907725 RepID=UPI0025FC3671|nr:NAD(P)-dependent oxidoreductase [Limnohabitans sp.]MCO4089409.1 NAD(P)-dependent oxidoreductase [Limnohabitans sp.]
MKGLLPVVIVGVGNMGGAMVSRLLELGWAVGVRDIDKSAQSQAVACGAVPSLSPRHAASMLSTDGMFLTAVVDAAQTQTVLWGSEGAGPELKPGQTVMLCSTLGPKTVQDQAERLMQCGVECIDAPMSGGPVRAQEGTMSLMVACSDAVWQRSQKLLTALSQQVFRVGPRAGDGARTKLVNNLLASVNLAGAAEAMALAERLGLDPAATLSVIEASSGQSWIGSDRMRRALAGDFEPRAHVTLLAKDTGLAVQAADDVAFDPPLGRLARDLFAQALGQGWADLDDAALLKLMRQR